jgi:hypothetical protein
MSDFQPFIDASLRANKARELILEAQAKYHATGLPTDVLTAMEPHIKAAIQGYKAKHVMGSPEANPEQSVAHIATLGAFGGADWIGDNLQRLLDKHGL